MRVKLLCFLIFILITFSKGFAQQIEFSAKVNSSGIFYSEEESPFWFHSNKRGRIDEQTNFAGWANANARFRFSPESFVEIGAGGLFQDGFTDEFQLDESYLHFQNNWLEITAGRKQKEALYKGLSASNENILWSLNARPMPGLQVKTNRPIFFGGNRGLGFTAAWEEYFFDEERFVKDVRLHHKSFNLVYRSAGNFEISAGLQHFVQWGGIHPEYGQLPGAFSDFLNVISGKEGEDQVEGQEANALGNHLGSYEVQIKTQIADYKVEVIYNHLFEDGSGRRLGNTPDGRYGIFVEPQHKFGRLKAVMYEFYYTKHQSSTSSTTDGADNYFNNNLYRSGWTYENRILGVPFIGLDNQRFRINNNKIIAHHIGISGLGFYEIPYKLITSFRKNFGAKGGGNIPQHNILSTYLDLEVYKALFDLNFQIGADFNSIASPNFGAGIQMSKQLF